MQLTHAPKGYTLIELMIGIAILGIVLFLVAICGGIATYFLMGCNLTCG